MLEIAHNLVTQIGILGVAGLWIVKAGLSYGALRLWKQRRNGARG